MCTIDSLFALPINPINIDKKPILMIWPPLEPSWRGDYNGGIIIITIIITNFYFFCITSVVVIVIMIQHCFSSRWSLKMIVMMIQPLKWLSRHASTIKDTISLTTLTLRSINYHSLAALRAYSSRQYIQYIYNIYNPSILNTHTVSLRST